MSDIINSPELSVIDRITIRAERTAYAKGFVRGLRMAATRAERKPKRENFDWPTGSAIAIELRGMAVRYAQRKGLK